MISAKSDLPQGTLDLLILKIVALGPVHGYAIAQRLQQVSRDVVQVPQGSLYPALHRLENRRVLASEWNETETGREAKFYRLTRKGRAQLETEAASWRRLSEAVGLILKMSEGSRAMNWWNRFWRRKQMDAQLERELAFHLEEHTSELIAQGYEPDEARRRARLDLGGPEQVKEQCRDARGTRWLEDLLQDFRYALRMLRKNPGFAAVALLTLALGSGATTVMFTVVNGVLLKPLSYPEPERLVALHGKVQQFGEPWGFSYPDFLDYQSQGQSVGPMAAWTYGGGTISEASGAEYVEGREISSELFSVLGVPLVRGRAFSREEDRRDAAPVAIISYALWQRAYGGRPDVIGGALTFEGKSYAIVGIAPPNFLLDGHADVFTPIGQNIEPRMQNRRAAFHSRVSAPRTGSYARTGADGAVTDCHSSGEGISRL